MTRYIDRAGSGIDDMTDACRSDGLPPPQIKVEYQSFVTVLRRNITATITANAAEIGGGNMGGNMGGNRIDTLPDQQLAVCRLMLEDPSITAEAIANKLGVRKNTVEKRIAVLKGKGIIVREGGTRGTWKVVSEGGSRND